MFWKSIFRSLNCAIEAIMTRLHRPSRISFVEGKVLWNWLLMMTTKTTRSLMTTSAQITKNCHIRNLWNVIEKQRCCLMILFSVLPTLTSNGLLWGLKMAFFKHIENGYSWQHYAKLWWENCLERKEVGYLLY